MSSFAGDGAKPRESELSDSLQGLIAHHFFCQVSERVSHKRISKCFLYSIFSLAGCWADSVCGVLEEGLGMVWSLEVAPPTLCFERVVPCLNSKDDLTWSRLSRSTVQNSQRGVSVKPLQGPH